MSCALWLKYLGFRPVLIDRAAELGGQLLQVRRINRWVLGFPNVANPELAAAYARHLREEQIDLELATSITQVRGQNHGFQVEFTSATGHASVIATEAIVIATGTCPKAGEAFEGTPGWEEVADSGRVSFFPLDHLDFPERFEGAEVVVVGGGDNAHFTTRDLARHAARVHLVIRSEPRAQPLVRAEVEALAAEGRVVEYHSARCTGFRTHGDAVELTLDLPGRGPLALTAAQIFARLGFVPGTDFVDRLEFLSGLARDARGFLITDGWRRTSMPRIYAAGDVANPIHPSVVAALADGALAARAVAYDCGAG